MPTHYVGNTGRVRCGEPVDSHVLDIRFGATMCHMTASLLDRAIYSYGDVDRLVGLHVGTARRWLEGYRRGDRFYEPVLRPEPSGSEVVTWGEMVEARLLAEFRGRDVPIQRLRPAVVRLRERFGKYPLALARPFIDVEGRELVEKVQVEVDLERRLQLVVVRSGQLVLSEPAKRFYGAVEYDDNSARSLRPEPRAPLVSMDPERSFGQPVVRAVRTETVAEAFRAGSSAEELADLYELTPEEVAQAIRFELIAGSERAA